jgi:plasmid stability protein
VILLADMKVLQQITDNLRDWLDSLKARLRVRAAHHGRSMEEEARQILRQALGERPAGRIWPTWRKACSARAVRSSSHILGSRRASRPISDRDRHVPRLTTAYVLGRR